MNRRQVAVALAAALMFSRLAVPPALGQTHQHGEDDIPDWYDQVYCCNKKDCAPVKEPDRLQFVWFRPDAMVWGPYEEGISEPAFLYLSKDYPGGILFRKESFRASLDGRYHRCIFIPSYDEQEGDPVPEPQPRCLYISGGA